MSSLRLLVPEGDESGWVVATVAVTVPILGEVLRDRNPALASVESEALRVGSYLWFAAFHDSNA